MRDSVYMHRLTEALVRVKALKAEDAQGLCEHFLQSEHEQFEDFLLEQGIIDKEDLLAALGKVYQVPYMDVSGYFFQTHILRMFPLDFLLQHAIIPYEHEGDILLVVAADPSDSALLAEIGEHVSYDVIFNVGIYRDIIDAVREYYDTSLTEPKSEERRIQNRDLNDLPVGREIKDQDNFLKDKVRAFEKHASKEELHEIEEHAHNAERHKK